MSDGIDWSVVTWEGNRARQRAAFQKLSFRERVEMLEEMAKISELLAPKPVVTKPELSPLK